MFTTDRVSQKRLHVRRSDGETFDFKGSKDELDQLEGAFEIIANSGAAIVTLTDDLRALGGNTRQLLDSDELLRNVPPDEDEEMLIAPEICFDESKKQLATNAATKTKRNARRPRDDDDEEGILEAPELTFVKDW